MKLNYNISAEQINHFFMTDPQVSYLGLPDEDLVSLATTGKYILAEGSVIYGVEEEEEGKLIGLIKIELFTSVTANVHFYLHSSLHKSGKLREVREFFYKYFQEETNIEKVIVVAPATCKHVHGPAERFGFKLEGVLTKSLVWRQELVDMYIYGLCIERSKKLSRSEK